MSNKALNDFIAKFGTVILSALLSATGLFLSRILEPFIAWFSFTSLKLLIKITKSETLRSLYADIKKGYTDEKKKG